MNRTNLFRKGMVFGIVVLFVGMSALPSTGSIVMEKSTISTLNGTTIYVDDDAPPGGDGTIEYPYQYIQDGIDSAINGDTVFVYSGTYYENVVIDNSIKLIGENRERTIIDSGGCGDVVQITADQVNITEFTIQNTTCTMVPPDPEPPFSGVKVESNHNNISGNIITNNGFDIYLWGSSHNIISRNIIADNISLKNNVVLLDSNDSENNIVGIGGIILEDSSNNNILGNTIADNNYGIYLDSSSDNNISGNTITDNDESLSILSSSNTIVTDNIFEDSGITIGGSSLLHWNTHTIDNNSINVRPIRYYVDMKDVVVPSDTAEVILVNCTNFTIQNLHHIRFGIIVAFSSHTDIIENANASIYLRYSYNNVISANMAGGISSIGSSNNLISDNTIANSYVGIALSGSSNDNIISENNVINSCYGLVVGYSDNNAISRNIITNNSEHGIYLHDSENNIINENTITHTSSYTDSSYGIYLDRSYYNQITENILTNNDGGIYLYESRINEIIRNIIKDNCNYGDYAYGIKLKKSSIFNIISGNVIANNYDYSYGIHIQNLCSFNTIYENTIIDNRYGIVIEKYGPYNSRDNLIYHNTFINNTVLHASDECTNMWDNDYPSGGNYWDDYNGSDHYQGPDQNISGSDGIGDTPYTIPGDSNQDCYPLMGPFVLFADANGPYTGVTYQPIRFIGYVLGGLPPYTYHWDFGDGNTSDQQNPVHNYTQIGEYNVILTVEDNAGNISKDITTATITEPLPLVVDVHGPYLGVEEEPIQFLGSAEGGIPPYNWSWNFGDGNTSEEQNPVHNYTQADEYAVILTVRDYNGTIVSNITTATITEPLPLVVDIHGPYYGAVERPLQFLGSAEGGVPPYNWSWNFGDGNTSEEQNPVHNYTQEGEYTVLLTVTDYIDNIANDTTTAFICPPPLYVVVDDDFNASIPGWGYNHFDNIQDAIDMIAENGTIDVQPGSYGRIVIYKSISLIGENKNNTIIRYGGRDDVVRITADRVNITGFTIQDCTTIYVPWPPGIPYSGLKILSRYNTISGNTVTNNRYGIILYYSENNLITRNTFTGNSAKDIALYYSAYNTINWNSFTEDIKLAHSHDNRITWNFFNDSDDGISIIDNLWAGPSTNNIISWNTFKNNGIGINIGNMYGTCENNHIYNNNFINNSVGIKIYSYQGFSNNNRIYHNNFINNIEQAYDECINLWDDDYPSGGNYWSDYNGIDNDGDGIGDTPYDIPGGSNQDRYPLMNHWIPGDLNYDGKVDQSDLGILLAAWDTYPGDPNWDPRADIDGDGHIYQDDLDILLANWGYGT